MKTRFVFGTLLWVSFVVGAVRVFGAANDPIGFAAPLVVGGLAGAATLLAVRAFTRRVRGPRRALRIPAKSHLPAGPRKVLLAHTGLTGPE